MAVVEKPIIVLSQLISDLNNGITRCKGDTGYNAELGSIEEKYGISKNDVKEIFKHPQLKNLRIKTSSTPNYVLQDDVTPKVEDKAVDNSNASTSTSDAKSGAESKEEVSSQTF